MKLKVEFEIDDLQLMFNQFFTDAGFEVADLDQLCEQFASAFPDGIKVDVHPLVPSADTSELDSAGVDGEVSHFEPPEDFVEEDEPTSLVSVDKGKKVTHTDLADPTYSGEISAINRLVTQSKNIEETKA